MHRTRPTEKAFQILLLPYLATTALLSSVIAVMTAAECSANAEKVSILKDLTIRPPYELNIGQLRDLTKHQPNRQWSERDYKQKKPIHPSNYAVLANPEKFDGQLITFVGYLWISDKNTGCEGKPSPPTYRVYANWDDFQHEDEINFVQVNLNRYFQHLDCFKTGDHVEAIGVLESKELLPDSELMVLPGSRCNKKLTNASLRLNHKGPSGLLSQRPALHRSPDHNCIIYADKITLDTNSKIAATGHVVLEVQDQNAFCIAENLCYDPWTKRVQASGEVHLKRPNFNKQFESVDFHIEDPNFLITEPDVTVHYPFLQAR